MHLIQLLMPIADNAGHPYSLEFWTILNRTLTAQFGGVTVYSRSPAKGQWIDSSHIERDDVVVVEVMTEVLDRGWWASFRRSLEREMGQKELVIRAQFIERL